MPMFGFSCENCGSHFEEWVRSQDGVDQVSCPRCHSRNVQKLLSRVAKIRVGSGAGTASTSANCSPGGL